MIEESMRNFLLAAPTLKALVADRIYGLRRPVDAALPDVMLQRSMTYRQVLFCGTSDLVNAQMQVDSYAMSGETVWAVAIALRKVLTDFSGTMDQTVVNQCHLANEFPLIDPDPGIIRVTQLYNIWYVED
jgi:hypothetical protein